MKDNYPLPKMDHILQKVVGAERISMLDDFSGYNQIKVLPGDQEKPHLLHLGALLSMQRCLLA